MGKVKVASYSETCKSIEEHLHSIENKDVVVRLGGTMPYEKYPVQINPAEGVKLSINKLIFNHFTKRHIPTFFIFNQETITAFFREVCGNNHFLLYGAWITKPLSGSGGSKIQIIEQPAPKTNAEHHAWVGILSDIWTKQGPFIIQPKINVTSEYRVHCSATGNSKVTKKVLKNLKDSFITRLNHKVVDINNTVKPRLLNEIIQECHETRMRMGMDILCFDVLYDSTEKEAHKFYLCESNTGPELIGSTKEWYISEINKLIELKSK